MKLELTHDEVKNTILGILGPKFNIETFKQADLYDQTHIRISTTKAFKYTDDTRENLVAFVVEAIAETPHFQRMLEKHAKELGKLADQNTELETIIAQLQPYKTYYELHYNLQHGVQRP